MGQVKLYKWEFRGELGAWHLFRTFKVSDSIINSKILEALEEGPYMFLYRWECFNNADEFQGNIYNNMYNTFIYEIKNNI